MDTTYKYINYGVTLWWLSACPGDFQVITGEGPLPMAIFELLEYIVNEVNMSTGCVSYLPCLTSNYICQPFCLCSQR